MNIGIVTTWFESGAAYVSRQYISLLEPDHKIFIYARAGCLPGKDETNWIGESNVTRNKEDLMITTYINRRQFTRWIKQNKLEVVFFNEQQWWEPLKWCKEMGIKTGAYVDYYTELTLPLFAIYDFLICNTKRHYSAFSWHQQCFFVPWGTDPDIFRSSTKERPENEPLVFFHSCGVDPYRKGTDLLIKAFRQIKIKCKLIIHTQVSIEERFPELAQSINDLQVSGNLVIIQKTIPAPGLFHLGDVYVYPSRLEGIGLTIAEALASGLPVVVPDYPPMNEFVAEEKAGFLIKVDRLHARNDGYYWPLCTIDINDLTAILEQITSQPNLVKQMQVNTRKYAEEKLNWKNNKEIILNIFEQTKLLPANQKIIDNIDHYQKFSFNKIYYFAYKNRVLVKPFSFLYKRITRKP